jgi:hypothetical protein
MSVFMNWIANFYASLAVMPFASFILLWFIFYAVYRNKKKATALSMDITTVLLIGAVSVMYDHIFPRGVAGYWWIFLFFLIGGGLIGNAQNRMKGSVNMSRLVRVLWRVGFLVLGLFYILFLFIGIGKSIWMT